MDFNPFENDTESTTLGPGDGLTFENGNFEDGGKGGIMVYGDFTINHETDPADIDNIIELMSKIKEKLILLKENKNDVKLKGDMF